MNTFYEFLIKEIKNDITTLLTDEKAPIRILFSGLPKVMLNSVFTYLCDGEKQLQISRDGITKSIPILLVDSSIEIDPKNLNSGRCTNNHLVTVRNTEEGSYFALHAIDDATHLSSETAAERRGIATQHHKSIIEWLEETFVSSIINSIIFKFHSNEQDNVRDAINEALAQAWDGDQRHRDRRAVWAIIEDVYVLTSNNNNSSHLYKNLGVPSIKDGDLREALKLPTKIASYFVEHGFDNGSELMVNELSDEESEIKEALKTFINAISVNCLMPSEFLDNPMANYARANEYEQFIWWNTLTNKIWDKLLGGYSEPQEYSILKIVCQDTLYNPISKSHPEVIQNGASFIITPAEGQGDVELEISKASGNKTLQAVDKITIKDEEVLPPLPAHIPLRRENRPSAHACQAGFHLDSAGGALTVEHDCRT